MLFLITLLIPLAGGLLLPLLRFRTARSRGIWVEAVVLAASCLMLWQLIRRPEETVRVLPMAEGLSIAFRLDGPACVFTGLVAFLWPLATLYGLEYMEHEERPDAFFCWYTVSYAITLAIAAAANLFTMYIFYECLTMVTLPLVTHKQDEASVRAGRKYVVYSMTGAALGFTAMMLVYFLTGTTEFAYGGIACPAGREDLLRILYIAAFLGFGVKAAVFPLHAWLPAASVAPTPVTALLHAVAVVNAGAYAVIRVTWYVFGPAALRGTYAQTAALALACFTVVFGAVKAVREQHLKRRLAYSTVSNLSYMLMGAALMTPDGLAGSLSHLVCHGLMKIVLFSCAGAILVGTGSEWVQEMRGYRRYLPFTCAVYAVAAVALTGIPPLAGFVSKWNLLTAAAATGTPLGTAAVACLILATVLTAIYALSPAVFFWFQPAGKPEGMPEGGKRDPGLRMKLPLVILTAAVIALGVWSEPLVTFLRAVAAGTL